MNGANGQNFAFEQFVLAAGERLLLRDGKPVDLTPKAFDLLLVLVRNGGHLVSKEQLFQEVWPDSYVEEVNLTVNISALRKALGDDRAAAKFIETVPKQGYRFVAPVRVYADAEDVLGPLTKFQTKRDPRDLRFRWGRWPVTAILIGSALVILAGSLFVWLTNSRVKGVTGSPRGPEFTQLTNARGEEAFPSLSPDGKFLVYSSSAGASADNWSGDANIYLLRIGSTQPINLTGDFPGGGAAPAFSPDGSLIAFRSERDGGGIFVMDVTGKNQKRLTEFGSHPSWSPDQKEIVFSTDNTWAPDARTTNPGELWLINVDSGEKRRLNIPSDATQPSWSPHGDRIAFWGQSQGDAKNIFTIPARGGSPVNVTNDSFVNWNPVWSPDGRYVYFLSNRTGSMNLWRVQIDETSGAVLDTPTAITTPATSILHPSFSRDGRHLAYVNMANTANIAELSWNTEKELMVGEPRWVTRVTTSATMPDLSPDGEWLVYGTLGGKEGDLFVIRTDGTGLRQLTKDPSSNRRPRWSPDGKRIAFESDRGGKFEIWIINADGSGLKKINSSVDLNMVEAFWSPDGTRLAFRAQDSGATFIAELGAGPNDQPVTLAEIPNSADEEYRAHSWSPDGRKLAGWSYRRSNGTVKDPEHKLCIYSFDTHRFEKLDTFGLAPIWLGDSRRLMFSYKGTVFLLDTTSKKTEKISTIDASGGFSVSPDGRRVFVSSAVYESDIWMMNLN